MSDEKGRATMFDDWDLKPKERARQLQGKVFELEAQNAGLVRALEAGIALATDFETAKDSDDELDVIHRLTAWGDQSAIEIKRAASRSLASPGDDGASPPGAPAGLRPARDIAHELLLLISGEDGMSFIDFDGAGGHSLYCDQVTAAIEADRASRPSAPMLDPGTRLLEAEELLHEWEASCTIETPPRLAYRTAKFLHQEAPTCGACGGSDSPPDFAGPAYKASWPCSECGRRRCCPDRCTRCAPPTEGTSHGK